jgi:alpha-galactosidase/6-phospho-beta-glucosidase family protein
MIPTIIQVCGTLRRWAPNASPTIRMTNPMRYVAKEDTGLVA